MPLSRLLLLSAVLALRTATAPIDAPPPRGDDALRVARIFSSGMVLQRNQPIVVWGWAAPQSSVTVSLLRDDRPVGRPVVVRSGASGGWEARLAPQPAGGPYRLRVDGGAAHVEFNDVLIGDVWLASGQSNMEWPLARDRDVAKAVAAAEANGNARMIREFRIPAGYSYTPEDSLVAGAWTPADSAHMRDMSAVAYYFARALRAAGTPGPRVPIGIINSTWGGSAIEAWMSRESQQISDADWRGIEGRMARQRDSTAQALRARLGDLPATDAGMVNGAAAWADRTLDDAAWTRMPVPSYWESNGFAGLDGIGWYRTTFTLSPSEAAAGVVLRLDAVDDDDMTWVNGTLVGQTTGYQAQRRYVIPARQLSAGANQLTVRVADGSGGGGINGPVLLQFADGSTRSLAGSWAFRVGQVSFAPDGQVINKVPSVVYNRMMRPIARMPVAGVLWYQGESNANNDAQAVAYRALFSTMVREWRRERHAPALPFLWVQLPNYGTPDREPPASATWALQRESMEAALTLPRTGQAVIIELGDPNDIHPRQKQPVGERLARVAQRVAYGVALESSGPTYRAPHRLRGDTVVLQFDHLAGGLRADERVQGFAIAGADRRFVWAEARVVGTAVHVWSERVHAPVAVRYAWSNSPTGLTLRNALDLPAAPFRTDRW